MHCRYLAALANATGLDLSFARRVESVYPLEARNGSVRMTLLDIMGDSNIGCTSFDTAMLASRTLQSFFYSFVFRAAQSGGEDFHASDLPFWWGNAGECAMDMLNCHPVV